MEELVKEVKLDQLCKNLEYVVEKNEFFGKYFKARHFNGQE